MVGVYIRISGNKEEDKDTSEFTQEQSGIAFAKDMQMRYETYRDIGKSGTTGEEKRDDFKRLLKDMRSGKIKHVFVINQARLERNPDVWRIFQAAVVTYDIKYYPAGSFYDLNNKQNRFMAGIMSLVNEWHAENTSDAVIEAFKKLANDGKAHGIQAYGIKKDEKGYMIHHPEEIEVVKKIFKWSLEGMGTYTIANKLNDIGTPTRYKQLNKSRISKDSYTGKLITTNNKKWWGSTVSGILKNETFMGIYVWGDKRISLPHLAILSEEDFLAVQENFKLNKKVNSGKNTSYNYLLNGLVFCFKCGSRIRGVKKVKSRDNSYKCRGKNKPLQICKGSRGFNIPRIETFIIKHLFLSKNLQKYLNAIEVDTDEIEVLELKVSQLDKKIKSQHKMVTKAFNNMHDPDLEDDIRFKDLYLSSKAKLSKMKGDLVVLQDSLSEQLDNNRLNRVNMVVEGYDVNLGFEAVRSSVNAIIERIDVSYISNDTNGKFHFILKYKGFNEYSIWSANQQLNTFTLNGYHSASEKYVDDVPEVVTPDAFKEYLKNNPDNEILQGLINDVISKPIPPVFRGTTSLQFGKLDIIELDKSQLINFN
ncbi:recombinase family protein [Lacinutrix iliipiscaria]|uniref:Recombinase family protein n=1 Tax=Lacinutrix iliipiscaria TaxID=1230532 RepID=A0ABW5WQY3_9FLAO